MAISVGNNLCFNLESEIKDSSKIKDSLEVQHLLLSEYLNLNSVIPPDGVVYVIYSDRTKHLRGYYCIIGKGDDITNFVGKTTKLQNLDLSTLNKFTTYLLFMTNSSLNNQLIYSGDDIKFKQAVKSILSFDSIRDVSDVQSLYKCSSLKNKVYIKDSFNFAICYNNQKILVVDRNLIG